MASYFSSTLISSPLLPALRGVFLCGTLRQNVAPHRYTVATSVGTVNSFAQIFSFSIDMAAQVPLPASARHLNSNHSARTTFAY